MQRFSRIVYRSYSEIYGCKSYIRIFGLLTFYSFIFLPFLIDLFIFLHLKKSILYINLEKLSLGAWLSKWSWQNSGMIEISSWLQFSFRVLDFLSWFYFDHVNVFVFSFLNWCFHLSYSFFIFRNCLMIKLNNLSSSLLQENIW